MKITRFMKLRYVLLTYGLLLSLTIFSQKIKVASMTLDAMDLTAEISPRIANDGQPCALLKVACPQTGITFSADYIVGDIVYDNGEYYVYLPAHSSGISISSPQYGKLSINFSDYKISSLHSKAVYHVIIDLTSDVSVDERVRLYKLPQITKEQITELNNQASEISLKKGILKSSEIDRLINLFKEGCLKAATILGSHYIQGFLKGDNVSPDLIQNGEFMLKVATEYNSDAYAANILGDYYYNSGNYERAFEYYFVAHTNNNVNASNSLAIMMENGIGTEKDVEGALDIWRELFWDRDYYARNFILKDEVLLDNFNRLNSYVQTASDFSSDSVVMLAREQYQKNKNLDLKAKTFNSIDVSKIDRSCYPLIYHTAVLALCQDSSIDAAIYFIKLFSRKRQSMSIFSYDVNVFYPENLPYKDELIQKSLEIIKKIASNDNVEAMRCLAEMYKNGTYVAKNEKKALEILDRGSQIGDSQMASDAAELASKLYMFKEASQYRQHAYKLGGRGWHLILDLADDYVSGYNVTKDLQKAYELYQDLLKRSHGTDIQIIEKRIYDLNLKIENDL